MDKLIVANLKMNLNFNDIVKYKKISPSRKKGFLT